MQLFNFEMGLNSGVVGNALGDSIALPLLTRGGTNNALALNGMVEATAKTMWFAYKPAIKFYIPCTSWLALELYGGVEVDLTKMWSKISTSYYADDPNIPEQNFFFGAFGGLGILFQAVPALPLEIKAEYRHPITAGSIVSNENIIPQGFYLTAQVHLGAPIHRDRYKGKNY